MVSIIIPYNEDRGYLQLCKESIEAQTYPNIELIPSYSPGTCGHNFNRGLEKATGEFVKYVDEDDWLPPDSIENLVSGIGDSPWMCANAWNVDKTVKNITKSVHLDFDSTLKICGIQGGTTLFRTEILREIGGMDESLVVGEEWDMYLRLMLKGYLPGYVDKEVYYYRRWTGSKSVIHSREWRDEQKNLIRARYES